MARVMVKIPDDTDTKTVSNVSAPAAPQTPASPDPGGAKSPLSKNNLVIGAVVIGVVLVVIMLVSLNNDKKHLKDEVNKLSSSQTNTQAATQKYQSEISKLVNVPAGITPEIRILTEETLNQLPKENGFKNAKSDDAIAVYKNPDGSLFIVIYRPSTQKIILATAATASSQQNTTTPAQNK